MIPYNDNFRRYLKPLSSGNEDEDQALGAKMLYLSKQVNQLKEQVEEQHLDRRSVCWKEVSEVVDFPQLDEERLHELTCCASPPAMHKNILKAIVPSICIKKRMVF